jgi:hypothetical protein
VALPSLSQDAWLSFVVIGRGNRTEGRGRKTGVKLSQIKILLWERLSAAI